MRSAPLPIVASLILGLGSAAAAADTSVALLAIEPPEAQDAPARRLPEALRDWVTASPGFRVLPGKELVEIKLVFGCTDEAPACMARAGKALGASKLLYGTLRRPSATHLRATMVWFDVATQRVEGSVDET